MAQQPASRHVACRAAVSGVRSGGSAALIHVDGDGGVAHRFHGPPGGAEAPLVVHPALVAFSAGVRRCVIQLSGKKGGGAARGMGDRWHNNETITGLRYRYTAASVAG
jgi:hypothetical protein